MIDQQQAAEFISQATPSCPRVGKALANVIVAARDTGGPRLNERTYATFVGIVADIEKSRVSGMEALGRIIDKDVPPPPNAPEIGDMIWAIEVSEHHFCWIWDTAAELMRERSYAVGSEFIDEVHTATKEWWDAYEQAYALLIELNGFPPEMPPWQELLDLREKIMRKYLG